MNEHRIGRTLATLSLVAVGLAACGPDAQPSAGPTVVPPAATAPTPTPTPTGAAAPTKLDGTSYFVEWTNNVTSGQIYSVTNGTVTKHATIAAKVNDYCATNSVMVSPDGQWLASATKNGAGGGLYGTLTVARIDGTNPRTLDNVICGIDDLSWTRDSRKLGVWQVIGNAHRAIYIDPATGGIEPAPADAIRSANGKFEVRENPQVRGTFTVHDAAGQVVTTVKDYSNDYPSFDTCGYTLKGVSDDGRYVTIGGCHGDPSRNLGARRLYDTVERRHVSLPVKIPTAIIFEPGGLVVVHGAADGSTPGTMHLMTTAGKVIQSVPDPQEVARATFLGYRLAESR